MPVVLLAWRNLWRQRRRTFLTVGAIGFAVAVLMFFVSMQLNSYDLAVRASVSIFSGPLQVQHEEYQDEPRMWKDIPAARSLAREVSRVAGVSRAAARAYGFAILSAETRSYGAQVVGVEPLHEPHVSTLPKNVTAGRFLSDANAYEAYVGEALAENLEVQPGDELTLLGTGRDGSVAATVLTISGTFQSGADELDRQMIEIPLGVFQETFAMKNNGHAIVATLPSLDLLPEVEREIGHILTKRSDRLRTLDWEELQPGLKQSIELDMASGWLFFASLILIVSFSVLNTVLMSVLERTRELGMMLALGATRRTLCSIVLLEGVFFGIIGVLLGIVLGTGLVTYFTINGFSIPGTEEILQQWHLPNVLYPRVTLEVFGIAGGIGFLATVLSCLYPAFRLFSLRAKAATGGGGFA